MKTKTLKTISKKLIEKFDIEIEDGTIHIHKLGGRDGYICFSKDSKFKITEDDIYWTIRNEKLTMCVWKGDFRFHITVF